MLMNEYRLSNLSAYVRFQALLVVNMKMAVFCVVVPCILLEIFWCFMGAYCRHYQGDRKHLCNVGQFL
jgi:hypothetical protein